MLVLLCFGSFYSFMVLKISPGICFCVSSSATLYCNVPKFSDRYAWANSADPDQRSSLIRVYIVCHSVCIFWTHYSMVEQHSSNFRVITTNVLGVQIFRKFTVHE